VAGVGQGAGERGDVGDGPVDGIAVPRAPRPVSIAGQLTDETGHSLGNRTALGPDLGEVAVMHPLGEDGAAGANALLHDHGPLINQHVKTSGLM
jgi:hypothetical protein